MGSNLIEKFNTWRSNRLAQKGFAHIRSGDLDEAIAVADKLERRRFTAAFEIKALVCLERDDANGAVQVLQKGLQKAPSVWLNWQLLGNTLSDLNRYDEADQAYAEALKCPAVDVQSVRLNQAIALSRRGRNQEALEMLETLTDPEMSLRVAEGRAYALRQLGRFDDALGLCMEYLGRLPSSSDDERVLEARATMICERAHALLGLGTEPSEVRAIVVSALEIKAVPGLWTVIREIDGLSSPNAQHIKATVHVAVRESDVEHEWAQGYFVTYDVVAESAEQALGWVRGFEGRSDDEAVTLDESSILNRSPDELMGVYWRSGRGYYRKSRCCLITSRAH